MLQGTPSHINVLLTAQCPHPSSPCPDPHTWVEATVMAVALVAKLSACGKAGGCVPGVLLVQGSIMSGISYDKKGLPRGRRRKHFSMGISPMAPEGLEDERLPWGWVRISHSRHCISFLSFPLLSISAPRHLAAKGRGKGAEMGLGFIPDTGSANHRQGGSPCYQTCTRH